PARDKVGPARPGDAAQRIILPVRANDAAVESLGVARDLAIEIVEVDDHGGRIRRHAIGSVGSDLTQPNRTSRTTCCAAIDAAAELIDPLCLGAVGAQLLDLAAKTVIAPGRGQTVRPGMAGRQTKARIILPALALPERVAGRGRELTLPIV